MLKETYKGTYMAKNGSLSIKQPLFRAIWWLRVSVCKWSQV